MPDTPTFTTRPLTPDEAPAFRGEHDDFVVIQRDGTDAFPAMRKDAAANWIVGEKLLIERGLTPAEELLGCQLKLYSRGHDLVNNPDDHWFHCTRHWMDAPCLESQVVAGLLERETRVRELVPDLTKYAREELAQALDGPLRCKARSIGDSHERCLLDEGHGPIERNANERWDHESRSARWVNR